MKITISIEGTTKSGKSRIAYILKEFLSEIGFETELVLIDHPTIESFDNDMSKDIDSAIADLIEKTKIIIIKEIQSPNEQTGQV